MATILADSFTGSGSLSGVTPTTRVGFGTETWTTTGVIMSGGLAIYDTDVALSFNPSLTSYSQSTDFAVSFLFRTGTSTAGIRNFIFNVYADDVSLISFSLYAAGGTSTYDIAAGDADGIGATTDISSITLSTNTTYTGTISYDRTAGGYCTITFAGYSFTWQVTGDIGSGQVVEPGDTNGFRGIAVTLPYEPTFNDYGLAEISVDDAPLGPTGNAVLTAPALTAKGYGGGKATITLPTPTVFSIYNGAIGMFDKPSPMLQLSATGTVTGGSGSVVSTLPMLTLSGAAGGGAAITLPSMTLEATGHNSDGERSLNYTFSALTLSAYGAGKAVLSAPSPSLLVTGSFANSGSAVLTAPALSLSATGKVSSPGAGAVILPVAQLSGYGGALLSVTLGNVILSASGTSGSVGRAEVSLPLFDLTATGTVRGLSSADMDLPALRAVPVGKATLILPGLMLTAIGSAVVTANYEAYAVNLNHLPKRNVEPVDEMTRYTNYPFTQVVRYKNSYYGVGADGNLYLLEGTADVATPIPWAFKTAITDFDSPTKKTIASGYFSGRFGPASAIALYSGEDGGTVYSYSTPRDTLAQNYRQAFGKGLKERYYQISMSGTGVLELDSIELDVHNLSRRI